MAKLQIYIYYQKVFFNFLMVIYLSFPKSQVAKTTRLGCSLNLSSRQLLLLLRTLRMCVCSIQSRDPKLTLSVAFALAKAKVISRESKVVLRLVCYLLSVALPPPDQCVSCLPCCSRRFLAHEFETLQILLIICTTLQVHDTCAIYDFTMSYMIGTKKEKRSIKIQSRSTRKSHKYKYLRDQS